MAIPQSDYASWKKLARLNGSRLRALYTRHPDWHRRLITTAKYWEVEAKHLESVFWQVGRDPNRFLKVWKATTQVKARCGEERTLSQLFSDRGERFVLDVYENNSSGLPRRLQAAWRPPKARNYQLTACQDNQGPGNIRLRGNMYASTLTTQITL